MGLVVVVVVDQDLSAVMEAAPENSNRFRHCTEIEPSYKRESQIKQKQQKQK